MTRRIFAAIAVLALGLGGLAPWARAQSNTITFNPTGPTGITLPNAASFDESPGNALAQGFDAAAQNFLGITSGPTTFTLLYQASVSTVKDVNNQPLVTYGNGPAGNGQQLTVVANLQEVLTSFSVINATTGEFSATFKPTGVGTAAIYQNSSVTASDLAGTGFTDGTKIWTGTSLPGINGSFAGSPITTGSTALDQTSDGNQYPGINTLGGGGGATNINFNTTFADPNYFPGGAGQLQLVITNTSNNLPFTTVNPAALMTLLDSLGNFAGSTPGATVASVGTLNASGQSYGTGLGGPNTIFQADANTTFLGAAAVPEPSTVVGASMAAALGMLCALRRHRASAA